MGRARWPLLLGVGALALAVASHAGAQKEMYRYIDADGKVVYTDKPPPPSAKSVQPKRLGGNVIDTSEVPMAARMASERYPVTLYTFDCGTLCQKAEALLNKRGIPFRAVNVSEPEGAAKLKSVASGNVAPVLQVGDKLVAKGLDEARWQAMLDEAGYPRTPPLRKMPPGKGTETPPLAKASTTSPPADSAPSGDTQPSAAAPPGGGYPK